ncbi:MAG: hypothetical protein WD036_08505 [Bauldia sp.]
MSSTSVGSSLPRVRYVNLHRNPKRRAYFASHRPGIQFDPGLDGWVVDEPTLVEKLLADRRLAAFDYAAHLRQHEAQFENLAFLGRFMPMWHEGKAHRDRRRDVANLLGERRLELQAALPAFVSNRLRPLFDVGRVEVMSEVLAPLLEDIGTILMGANPRELGVDRISTVFDRFVGRRRLVRLDVEIGEVRAAIRRAVAPDEEREGLILVLLVLSYHSLLGTLGESLRHIFLNSGGVPLGETAIPPSPPESGVPFVEREIREPTTVRGHRLKEGDLVRLMLQSLAYSADPASHVGIFGVGTHACLGKRLATDVWVLVAAELARLKRIITVVEYAPRRIDLVFACPDRLTVIVG